MTAYPRDMLKAGAAVICRCEGPQGIAMTHAEIVAAVLDATLAPSVASLDVCAERKRQIEAEGFDAAHDDFHCKGEIAKAAACYALHAGRPFDQIISPRRLETIKHYWPWAPNWFKPTNRRRDLVKAGALILAEIERIDRAAAQEPAT